MLRLILFLIFLVASVWLGLEILRHPGYLLLVYQPWMVQMPLWFALLSLIIFLLLFYLLIDSIDRFHLAWYRFKNWLRFRREQQSFSKTQLGLAALIEGRWKHSENLLIAGAHQAKEPLINYLGAAKAAHEQKAYDRRDQYIQKAYHIAPRAAIAIGITQAKLEIEQHQLEHAVATLNHLRQLSPKHPEVLKLLEKTYVKLGDWKNLLTLLPALRKAKILSNENFELFEKNLYCQLLRQENIVSLQTLQKIWNEIPRHMRKNPEVVQAYVEQLARFPDTQKEIEELTRKALKHTFSPGLVKVYSQLNFPNPSRQLVIAGAWLAQYGQKPELLLLLGKICTQVQLWGKAKDYFERCLSYGPNAEASLAYGKLLEQLDEHDEAIMKYRDGLKECSRVINHEADVLTFTKA